MHDRQRQFLGCSFLLLGGVFALLVACGGDAEGDAPRRTQDPLRVAASHADPWIRAELMRLLGLLSDERHANLLQQGIEDPSAMVRAAATWSLIERGEVRLDALAELRFQGMEPEERVALMQAMLRRTPARAQRALLEPSLRDSDPQVRRAAFGLAAAYQVSVSRPLMIAARDDRDPVISESAMRWLQRTEPAQSFHWVLEEIGQDNSARRLRALRFAGILQRPELWPLLLQLRERAEGDELQAITMALGMLGDPRVEDALRTMILTGDESTVLRAFDALIRIRTDRAREQPLLLLRDQRPTVRRRALDAMVELDYPMEQILERVRDRDAHLARRAFQASWDRDPPGLARWLFNALNADPVPKPLLLALFAMVDEREDAGALLEVLEPLLLRLLDPSQEDEDIFDIAARLLLRGGSHAAALQAIEARGGAVALTLLGEDMLRRRRADPSLVDQLHKSDLLLHQVIATLAAPAR